MTQPLRWLGGPVDVRVQVATVEFSEGHGLWDIGLWDEALWAPSELGWADISQYVISVTRKVGQDRWHSRFGAASLIVKLDNTTGIFSPTAQVPAGQVPYRPGRLIRLVVLPDPDSDSIRALFTGRIQSSIDSVDPAGHTAVATVTALDMLADLHIINLLALETATGVQTTSERVHAALDRANWPSERRLIQGGQHSVQTSYLAQSVLEECQRAAEAEGGAFFCNGDGVLVFKARDWLLGGEASMDAYADATLDKTPVAYWRMGDDADISTDSTGNGYTLTWNGSPTTTTDGVIGDSVAVVLDGSNDYATVATEGDLNLHDSNFTIEMWLKPDESMVSSTVLSCRASANPLYEISYDPLLQRASFFPYTGAGSGLTMASLRMPVGEWSHLVVTVQLNQAGDQRLISLYVNGERVVSSGTSYVPDDASRTWNLGRRAVANDQYFKGAISELAIYAKALTDTEVAHQYDARNRDLNARSAEVQAYLGYDPDPDVPSAELVGVKHSWELARVINEVTFARIGGDTYTASDSTSQDDYGKRTYQRLDFQNNSDEQVEFLADRFLAAYKDLRVRIDEAEIAAGESETDFRPFYDLTIGDLVSVQANLNNQWTLTQEAHVIGVTDVITADEWRRTLRLDDSAIAFGADESSSSS